MFIMVMCNRQEADRWIPSHDRGSISANYPDIVSLRSVLIVVQRDISNQNQMEKMLMAMSEGQLSLLSNIFPRSVIHQKVAMPVIMNEHGLLFKQAFLTVIQARCGVLGTTGRCLRRT